MATPKQKTAAPLSSPSTSTMTPIHKRHRAPKTQFQIEAHTDNLPPGPYGPPAGVQNMRADLLAFGIPHRTVRALLAKSEEIEVDSLAQIPNETGAEAAAAQKTAIERHERERRRWRAGRQSDASSGESSAEKRERGGGAGHAHEYLHIDGRRGSNWVLFEPERGYPPTLPEDVPEIFERYAHFKPGNAFLLEVNLESDAVRLRSVPEWLRDKEIEYGRNGPKVVNTELILVRSKKADRVN